MRHRVQWRHGYVVIGVVAVALAGAIARPQHAKATASVPTAAIRHVVHAGWTNPGGSGESFIYTSFAPQRLQVHRNDVVEWQFPAGYGGWHSVTFVNGEKPAAWRTDEVPGLIGFADAWAYGHEGGDEEIQCGRKRWHSAPDQPDCHFTLGAIDAPGEQFSSNVLDRFFSTTRAGAFAARIDLPEGTYRYFCKMHEEMEGSLEVLPATAPLANPTEAELLAQRDADFAAAKARVAEASRGAWDPVRQEWRVLVGTHTADRRVGIYEYLPNRIRARRGDRIRFIAGTSEPNSVTFTPAGSGGFNLGGYCGANSCDGGTGAPHGLTGFAYLWACEYDARDGGVPGIPLAWVPSRAADGMPPGTIERGCVERDGLPGIVEMAAGPYMSSGQPAPGNLVADPTTFHNSGILIGETVADWMRRKPDGTAFPSTFEARMPTAGTFTYFCLAHEFMKGQIDVA